jgi:hypothetical protein
VICGDSGAPRVREHLARHERGVHSGVEHGREGCGSRVASRPFAMQIGVVGLPAGVASVLGVVMSMPTIILVSTRREKREGG